jgi:glycosyltransferase involved in cell wall biosynthesis
MIGGGNESHLRTVMETAAGINNIEFTGFVPYDKVERHFDGASLIINTSITEGFPNTFLQGWSRGVPSVSFFDPDAYIDGKSVGVVVKSMEEMISRVKNLKSDDALWKVYSEDCRRYFWQNFSLDKICDEYEVLFDRLNAVCGSLDS